MPWRDPQSIPLTRIDIVSQVPSESGVYAIFEGEACLSVGEAWNLKARLLETMNVFPDGGDFTVIYELCEENERLGRKDDLARVLIRPKTPVEPQGRQLPGISFWNSAIR